MGQREYVASVDKYAKALKQAEASLISTGDKAKLLKLLGDVSAALKVSAMSEKFTEENNKLFNALLKISGEFKKFNTAAKKAGQELDAGVKAANSARSIAGQQKGFDKSKDFTKMSDDMQHVSDWLDICKPKEMKLSEFADGM